MKNIYITLVLLFLSFNMYSQEKGASNALFNLQKKKVKIDLDKTIFTNVTTNMYVSQKPDVLILALFIPISYDKQKDKLKSKPIKAMDFKGEIVQNNEKVLFLSGNVIKKGTTFIKQKYYIKYTKNTIIELTTMLAANADKNDKKMLLEIVNSVIGKN